MNNEVYFKQIKPFYNSLKYFDVKNNYLILNKDNTFVLPLKYTNLQTVNNDIFLAHPNDIFHFFQMHELLFKTELSEKEKLYIKEYTNKYIELKNSNNEGSTINNAAFWCMELLISKAFEESFLNNPASQQIISVININNKDFESGLGTGLKLVLTKNENPNFQIPEEFDGIKSFEKAGFSTLFLILITVALTCAFIAFFIIKK